MKITRKLLAMVMAAAICVLGVACGGTAEAPKKDYTSGSGSFTISVPGEWTVGTTGNQESILLDNDDQSLSVIVQKFPSSNMGITDLDGFISLYHESVMSALLAGVETPELKEITVDGMKAAKVEEFAATQDGVTAKVYAGYIQSETAFYSYAITGLEKVYDKNIERLKPSVTTLKENA